MKYLNWPEILQDQFEYYADTCTVGRSGPRVHSWRIMSKKNQKHIRAIVPIVNKHWVNLTNPKLLLTSTSTLNADLATISLLRQVLKEDANTLIQGDLIHVSVLDLLIECYTSFTNVELHQMIQETEEEEEDKEEEVIQVILSDN